MTFYTRQRLMGVFHKEWNEKDHPREPAGSEKGGQFASGGGGGGTSGGYQTPEWIKQAQRDAAGSKAFRETLANLGMTPKPGEPGSALPGTTVGDVQRAKESFTDYTRRIFEQQGKPVPVKPGKPHVEPAGAHVGEIDDPVTLHPSTSPGKSIQRNQKRTDEKQARIIRRHYGLNRAVTSDEVRDEIANLKRKAAKGGMDDSQERLYAALNLK